MKKIFIILLGCLFLICGCSSGQPATNEIATSTTKSDEQILQEFNNNIEKIAAENGINDYVTNDIIYDSHFSIEIEDALKDKYLITNLVLDDIFTRQGDIYAKFNDYFNNYELKCSRKIVDILKSSASFFVIAKINDVGKFRYEISPNGNEDQGYDLDIYSVDSFSLYGDCIAVKPE